VVGKLTWLGTDSITPTPSCSANATLLQGGHRTAQVGRHDERALRGGERAGNFACGIHVETAGRHRLPLFRIDGHARHFALEYFARRGHINRSARCAVRKLQRTMHDLLGVRTHADFVLVTHITAHQATLVRHVLDPLDEFIATAARFTFLRGRRHASDDEHRCATLGGVVNRAAQRLMMSSADSDSR